MITELTVKVEVEVRNADATLVTAAVVLNNEAEVMAEATIAERTALDVSVEFDVSEAVALT